MIIFTKFHEDWTKNVDFLLMANFWMCLVFSSDFNSTFRALYNGIIPGLQRQMAFSAIRIGAYEPVKQKYIQLSGAESSLSLLGVRIAAGVTTGTIGK